MPGSTLNLVSPWMDGKQMLPYMDTDGQDHVRGWTSARCNSAAHLQTAEITGVKLPWQQACIIVTAPSVLCSRAANKWLQRAPRSGWCHGYPWQPELSCDAAEEGRERGAPEMPREAWCVMKLQPNSCRLQVCGKKWPYSIYTSIIICLPSFLLLFWPKSYCCQIDSKGFIFLKSR